VSDIILASGRTALVGDQVDASKSDRGFGVMLGAAGALLGAYIYMGLKTPLPGQSQDVAAGLQVERHEFSTPDGLILRLKRYSNPDGTPVLFCHGFGGNGFEFDLPREDHNMAVHFARSGYDVWISSFRGCGLEPYDCEGGDWQHSIDHLAVYDAPTLVDGITGVTGKKPFWIGHSMGGMVLYMYLQGVRFEGDWSVVSDPDLVTERNEKLMGGVAIASPPAMCWPEGHMLEVMSGSSIGRSMLGMYVLVTRLRSLIAPRVRTGSAPRRYLGRHPRVIMALARSPLATLYYRPNIDADTATSLVMLAGDDVSGRMSVQLSYSYLNRNFLQYFPMRFSEEPYDYTDNMRLISLPLLFIAGGKDLMYSHGIKRYGYDRVASGQKKYIELAEYGHTDLVMGRNVAQDVYWPILEWMREIGGR